MLFKLSASAQAESVVLESEWTGLIRPINYVLFKLSKFDIIFVISSIALSKLLMNNQILKKVLITISVVNRNKINSKMKLPKAKCRIFNEPDKDY